MIALPRLVTLVTTAILLATSAEECEVENTGKEMACRVDSKIEAKNGLVVGTSTATCRKRPNTHTFTIILESQDIDGQWHHGGRDFSTVRPHPRRDVTLTARHMCFAALWRLRVAATGEKPGRHRLRVPRHCGQEHQR